MQRVTMIPAPGERLLKFVGDRVRFAVPAPEDGRSVPPGQAFLRTNLGQAALLREEVIGSLQGNPVLAGASWRDIPMLWHGSGFAVEVSLTEIGYFDAKAYLLDSTGRQHWPEGPNAGISVHPDEYRTANTIYCAFPRMFGPAKSAKFTINPELERQLADLEKIGFATIPPSGKLRDLIKEFPHIFDTLGCRILHLLPVNPVPATYARFGRFGSPYAVQNLTAIDPALVEFDRRTTGIDQFRELTYAAHAKNARVFLDVVINHTGWGSDIQEDHPEWFLREADGRFVSPGAWGTVWEDLVELNHKIPDSWNYLAEVFLTWCRRGVDGFRCDAGYKVPAAAWRYLTSVVRGEFPDTVFLLEGLGGSWDATESLLCEGGMQWAYSELFQNHGGLQVSGYLDHSIQQSTRVGLLAHYSETHDNERLASRGRGWSLMRNRLCGLASHSGAFGFTCGVEWLATERIDVHQSRALAWNNPENLVPELAKLNQLLASHPCFFDGAALARLSLPGRPVYALRRKSAEGLDQVMVLVNLDPSESRAFRLAESIYRDMGEPSIDLLDQPPPQITRTGSGDVEFVLEPGASFCLSVARSPAGLSGQEYRAARACAAFAVKALREVLAPEDFGPYDWRRLAGLVRTQAVEFLSALPYLDQALARNDLHGAIEIALRTPAFPPIVLWEAPDARRITLVPANHWLVIRETSPFRAALKLGNGSLIRRASSTAMHDRHVAFFPPREIAPQPVLALPSLSPPMGEGRGEGRLGLPPNDPSAEDATLDLERYGPLPSLIQARLRFAPAAPCFETSYELLPFNAEARLTGQRWSHEQPLVLLTNGIGGMARLRVDLGQVQSKYDCLLGANLHPTVPVDRHILAKRVRVWIVANGFIAPLDRQNLLSFQPGPPARWRFLANAGAGRVVELTLAADMLTGSNSTVLTFTRAFTPPPRGCELPSHLDVRLTVRVDIEDRNFHSETRRTGGADAHFASHCHPLPGHSGFEFTPAPDRLLRVYSDSGSYHHEAEWTENLSHFIEGTRGQQAAGDAYSPGWFDIPLPKGAACTLVASAEQIPPDAIACSSAPQANRLEHATVSGLTDSFGRQLAMASDAFVVRRHSEKTVIAGYPWFLDWGRDSLICARGLIAAGRTDEVRQLLVAFGRFERDGTLPNTIHGDNASNRDTSDAPLWFGVACEELAAQVGAELYGVKVDSAGRTIADVLSSLAAGYRSGTPNGIKMDPETALIWSPKHFTWMDTNHPAGTPREGYPIEIQALWIRLLRQLGRLGTSSNIGETWASLASRAEASLDHLFWIESKGYPADAIIASPGVSASAGQTDDALRSNYLIALTFGLFEQSRARRAVAAAERHLVVPGALRSLAPLPVSLPLPIYSHSGFLLNDPHNPYWGHYEGDEDTRRKPAYHNGTAWTWTLPIFCEALARAWDFSSPAVATAKCYLGSMDRLLTAGCLGQIPEILDGDAPHMARGCDAQAWSVTEALRVWKLLNRSGEGTYNS